MRSLSTLFLILVVLAGCAGREYTYDEWLEPPAEPQEDELYPQPVWPYVPCPPLVYGVDAGTRLLEIWTWSSGENRRDVARVAEWCRFQHEGEPDHLPPAHQASRSVYRAWELAWRALNTEYDPALRDALWDQCREELDHN